jgi:putative ABC transport system permease protein
MTALNRKLARDVWQMKTQAIAISLVMACGVATFVMSLCTLSSMERMRDAYYDRYRFAHVFTHLKRAPDSLATRIADIPGVAGVQTRVVVDVTLNVPGLAEPAVGRLVSIPDRPRAGLNDLHLRRGRYIEPRSRGEVLANEAFADAHGFRPGDRLKAVINGRLEELTIVGIALSPEFVYQIRPGEILPDDKRFGVLWMGDTELAAAFDLVGAFNDIALTLMRNASEPEVLRRLDDLTEPYGGLGAYSRADQLSHRFVSDELTQLRAMASIPPAIFLAVAAFLLNVVLNRLISTQREQIAALKAFGYKRIEVGLHFLKLALAIVFAGTVLGTAAGAWLGSGLTALYSRFFRFPAFAFSLEPGVVLLAATISFTAGLLGVAGAVRRAMKLPPAEAMRPEPPASYRPTLIERIGLQRLLSHPARMILRQLERRPLRAVLSSLGIAMAVAVMVLGSFSRNLIDYVTNLQFNVAQRYDVAVAFVEPASGEAVNEVARLPGVLRSEPYRSVPVRMRFGHHSRRLGITGLVPARELFRLIDIDLRPVPLPEEGLVISEKLAEVLHANVGDDVTIEVLEGERPVHRMRIAALLRDFTGMAAYMDIRALHRVMREGDTISGAFLACDGRRLQDLYTKLKETPRVSSVTSRSAALASFQETISENLLRMRLINVIFGCIIAFGVVYNSARITLSERNRELATLRVIGFTRGEISFILLGEVATVVLAAIPAGLLAGYGLAAVATAALETETQRFPLVVESGTYAFAALVIAIAAFLSGLVVRRRLDHLNLVAVLKSRD